MCFQYIFRRFISHTENITVIASGFLLYNTYIFVLTLTVMQTIVVIKFFFIVFHKSMLITQLSTTHIL